MYEYQNFDIIEVAGLCGISLYQRKTKTAEYKARCPFCGDKKYHLGINRDKERFHCFLCNESGNSVSLYAKVNNISNREAYEELRKKCSCSPPQRLVVKTAENPIRSLYDRHNVYYDFLNMLRLEPRHYDNLVSRGLDFNDIHRFMYKSMPQDMNYRRKVIAGLSQKHNLDGIPGFFRADSGEWCMYTNKNGGIFIPVCDKDGYIQGLQVRLDICGGDGKKFRWFSTNGYRGGTGAKSWVHVVGDVTSKTAFLTEGPMKSDISSVLSGGKLFLAIPGVNSTEYLTDTILQMGIERINIMLDMDKRTNENVRAAVRKIKSVLSDMGVEYREYNWNPRYNGIDDYMAARARYQTAA